MTQELLKILAKTAYTEHDFRRLLSALQVFLEFKLFTEHPGVSFEKLLERFFLEHHVAKDTRIRLTNLPKSFLDSFTQENFYEKIDSIEKTFKKLPRIILYVPIALTSEVTAKIGIWLREHVVENLVIRLEIDAELAVGCALVWKGVYYDYSFRYLAKKHEEELGHTIREYVENV